MDLFLDNSWESNLIEHFVNYTQLSKNVNIIRLSAQTLSLIQTGALSIQVPSLVAPINNLENKTVEISHLTTAVSICLHLATISGTRSFLFGADYKSETNNISYVEIAKNSKNIVKDLNSELETKTYFLDSHITFADLAVFFASYQSVIGLSDDQKWEFCNFFRWFNHVQNLPGVQSFLQDRRLPSASFPARPKAVAQKKAKKEKKIGTMAPEKKDKPKQQPPQQKQKQQQGQKDAPQVKDKKQKNQPAPKEPEFQPTDPLFFEQNIDIRVGELKKVWKHPDSEKLWCEEIDVGEGQVRQIASGLQQFVPLEGMTGLVCVMTNLKPKNIAKFPSNGMVVCASSADKSKVQLLRPPAGAKIGDRVVLEGHESKFRSEPLAIQNPKKKILESAFPLLKSDGEGVATYNGLRFKIGEGYCRSESVPNGTVG